MPTIVTEFDKSRYKRLPMRMCSSGDIFQAKIEKLLGDIDGRQNIHGKYISLNKGELL